MTRPVVLFDLDGTVLDSGPIILAGMRHATRTVLGRDFDDAELLQALGGGDLKTAMAVFSEHKVDELIRLYREYIEPLHGELEVCIGMEEILVRLHKQGRRLGVVTTKRRSTVELAFASVSLGHLFETVVGGDETENQKPHPEPLLLAARRMGVAPSGCAYVGDSPFDIRAAKAAGMLAIAVTWGKMHERTKLEREQPDAIVNTAETLLEHV